MLLHQYLEATNMILCRLYIRDEWFAILINVTTSSMLVNNVKALDHSNGC